MAAVVVSKCAHSGTVSASVTTEATSASQRPMTMLRSPSSSMSTPAPIGSQMRKESSECMVRPCLSAVEVHQEPAKQEREANHHPERVGVEVAVLHESQHAAEPAHPFRGAIHQSAIDQHLSATSPQADTDAAGERADHVLIEPVEVVLLDQHAIQPAESLRRAVRPCGVAQEEEVGGDGAGDRQPEGRREEPAQRER